MKKEVKQFHSPTKKTGGPDSYGSGVRNKVGKIKSVMGITPQTSKKFGKPPKSLA